MRSKLQSIFFLFAFVFVLNQTANAQTMHLIVFAGTDDVSANLRRGIRKTKEDVKIEYQLVANQLNMHLSERVFSGLAFNYINLQQVLGSLHPAADDVVVFYFIGHGVNKPEVDRQWPQLAFKEGGVGARTRLVPFMEIVDQLERKNQRLLIAIAETCNDTSGITEYFAEDLMGMVTLNYSSRDIERLKDLYIRSEGTIICSSSEPGQRSVVVPGGGVFASAFLEVHKDLTSLSCFVDWNTLFEKTRLRTISLLQSDRPGRLQSPQFQINVRGIAAPEMAWENEISNPTNVFQQQPGNFSYQSNYYHPRYFLLARIVFFNSNKVYFLMSDNYITEYLPYSGLRVVGYRSIALQSQLFQWDIISHYSPVQYSRWGVDYFGRIMEWHPRFGWQFVGIVYY